MKTNQKYSQEEMYGAIEEWQQENISQAAYCRQHGYSRSAFKYWLKKYREEKGLSTVSHSRQAETFIPLEINTEHPPCHEGQIQISYPNGLKVSCPVDISPDLLKSLIIP